MKKTIYYLLGMFLLCAFGIQGATTIEPYVAPEYFYSVNGTPTIRTDMPIKFEIQMSNDDGFTRQDVSIPLTFYVVGSDYDFNPVDVGGYSSNGSVELLNGFEPGGFWDQGSGLTEFSWNGVFPEDICYNGSASAGNGWGSGLGLQTYMAFNFEFYVPWDNEIYFCIDSAGFGEGYEWLFEEPSPVFEGPFCYPVRLWYVEPVDFLNCPGFALQAIHSEAFDYYFQASDPEGDLPYNFVVIDGPGTIDEHSGLWRYNPDVSEAGDEYEVVVGVSTAGNPNEYTECSFMVEVASATGDANTDRNVDILDVVDIINYLYKDNPRPWHFYHADVYGGGELNLLDAMQLINYLYKDGELLERNLKDDMPLRIGSYCKYERFRRAESITDTVIVSVPKYSTLRYQYPDSAEDKQFLISNKWVHIPGQDDINKRTYSMPLEKVGHTWYTWDALGNKQHNSVTAIQAIDDLPVGYIEDAYKIQRTSTYQDTETISLYREEWFAPGIGMAKLYIWNSDTPAIPFDESWELIEYNAVK